MVSAPYRGESFTILVTLRQSLSPMDVQRSAVLALPIFHGRLSHAAPGWHVMHT